MKFCASCGNEIATKDGDNHCESCDQRMANGKRTTKRAQENRKAIHEAMTDLGLVRVRGALGGVYYE